jgi:tRNA1(Val) A37 N6-methylase TrmN6
VDSFYTPDYLAELLVNYASIAIVDSVADFCVGEGELLKAASKKWPNAELFGTDISIEIIKKLNHEHPNWTIEYCDLISEESREQCDVLNNRFDIILLNPPFTCKGATISTVNFEDNIFKMSTAMSFLIASIPYLRENGSIYAILPQSVAYSEKDAKIWQYLSEYYGLQILEERHNKDFHKCTPNTILISLTTKGEKKATCTQKRDKPQPNLVHPSRILRGQISMYQKENYISEEGIIPLVHTTNMKNNAISGIEYHLLSETSIVHGPALLLPRVGNYGINKIVIIDEKKKCSISDCVIAFEFHNLKGCRELFDYISKNWDSFLEIYKGTGAKYTTLKRIRDFFGFTEE